MTTTEPGQGDVMTTKERDRRATGPDPSAHVARPVSGARCPRCHRRGRGLPCLLCAPALVPYAHRSDWRRCAVDAARLGGLAGRV